MSNLENILRKSQENSYTALKNYVLMREFAYNSKGNKEISQMDDNTIEKYFKAYENISKENINLAYPNYKDLIKSMTNEIKFFSEIKKDDLLINLICHANALELNLTHYDPNNSDKTYYSMMTILDDFYRKKTYSIFLKDTTKFGEFVEKQSIIIKKTINETISAEMKGRIVMGVIVDYVEN